MKNGAQWTQEQNQDQASPTGTACLIEKKLINLGLYICSAASSCSPSGAKTSQMGVPDPAAPKYIISCPNFPPNVPNSQRNHPTATSGIVDVCLLAAPTPAPRGIIDEMFYN